MGINGANQPQAMVDSRFDRQPDDIGQQGQSGDAKKADAKPHQRAFAHRHAHHRHIQRQRAGRQTEQHGDKAQERQHDAGDQFWIGRIGGGLRHQSLVRRDLVGPEKKHQILQRQLHGNDRDNNRQHKCGSSARQQPQPVNCQNRQACEKACGNVRQAGAQAQGFLWRPAPAMQHGRAQQQRRRASARRQAQRIGGMRR